MHFVLVLQGISVWQIYPTVIRHERNGKKSKGT